MSGFQAGLVFLKLNYEVCVCVYVYMHVHFFQDGGLYAFIGFSERSVTPKHKKHGYSEHFWDPIDNLI